MDVDMVNLAQFVASELRAVMIPGIQLYKSGNMQRSVAVVNVSEDFIDIIIATDYASFTNTKGRHAGWIEETLDRACRAFCSNNNVDNEFLNGQIVYGG